MNIFLVVADVGTYEVSTHPIRGYLKKEAAEAHVKAAGEWIKNQNEAQQTALRLLRAEHVKAHGLEEYEELKDEDMTEAEMEEEWSLQQSFNVPNPYGDGSSCFRDETSFRVCEIPLISGAFKAVK